MLADGVRFEIVATRPKLDFVTLWYRWTAFTDVALFHTDRRDLAMNRLSVTFEVIVRCEALFSLTTWLWAFVRSCMLRPMLAWSCQQ